MRHAASTAGRDEEELRTGARLSVTVLAGVFVILVSACSAPMIRQSAVDSPGSASASTHDGAAADHAAAGARRAAPNGAVGGAVGGAARPGRRGGYYLDDGPGDMPAPDPDLSLIHI